MSDELSTIMRRVVGGATTHPAIQRLVRLAASVDDDLGALAIFTSGANVVLVGHEVPFEQRGWFPLSLQLSVRGSGCVIDDLTQDAQFAQHAMVVGEPRLRMAVGFDLTRADGSSLGTLCVTSQRPRKLSPRARVALEEVAQLIVAGLEATRAVHVTAAEAADERQRAERLQVSEMRARMVVEHAGDGIVIVDSAGIIVEVNRIFCELAGRSRDELVGARLSAMVRPFAGSEWEVATPQGELRRAEVTNGLLPDGGTIGVWRDLTSRRALEQRLFDAERLASVGTLAAGVAHEINNPLAFVSANVAYVSEELVGSPCLDADLNGALVDIRAGIERIEEVVQSLKTFARRDEERRKPIDVQRVVDFALRMGMSEIRQRATVAKRYEGTPRVLGNESRFGLVVLNLLLNAAQAMPESHESARGRIDLTTRTASDGSAEIVVADDGHGMTAEVMSRIFDPYFTTKGVRGGMGLGLALSYNTVREMGGELTVESVPGQGTTFTIRLPGVTSTTSVPPPSDADVVSADKGCVLIVDDEAAICSSVCRTLRDEFHVECASNGKEALALLLADRHFDVVICDLMMPELTGMDFHAALTVHDAKLAQRTLFLTGGAVTERARAFVAENRARTIAKPFRVDDLRARVRAVVSGASGRAHN